MCVGMAIKKFTHTLYHACNWNKEIIVLMFEVIYGNALDNLK